jgi:hypothetical protein
MCACTESDVKESATRLHSKRRINFTLGLKVRQCALLSALLTHSAIGSYTNDPRQMLFRLHAPFPVSYTVERTVQDTENVYVGLSPDTESAILEKHSQGL